MAENVPVEVKYTAAGREVAENVPVEVKYTAAGRELAENVPGKVKDTATGRGTGKKLPDGQWVHSCESRMQTLKQESPCQNHSTSDRSSTFPGRFQPGEKMKR